jgi:indolepyruvate ferredoxin oxidoreductase
MGITPPVAAEIGLRVYKVGMPWPLEPQVTHDFAEGLEEILVVEEKRSVIEDQLTGQLYNYPVARGRASSVSSTRGARPAAQPRRADAGDRRPGDCRADPALLPSEAMEQRIRWIEEKELSLARPAELAERVPHFCSGCPHNTSTRLPEGSHAMGGIGCHYMATWMPDRPTLTFTQMGGEGVTWIGQAPFTDTQHVFQNLGDGTYFHSGILAVRAAVAAGRQHHLQDSLQRRGGHDRRAAHRRLPDRAGPAAPARTARACGASPWSAMSRGSGAAACRHRRPDAAPPRRDGCAAARAARAAGTTVIVYQQTCAAEKRRRRKKGSSRIRRSACSSTMRSARAVVTAPCSRTACPSCRRKRSWGASARSTRAPATRTTAAIAGFCPSFVTVLGGSCASRRPRASADGCSIPCPSRSCRTSSGPGTRW